MQASEVKEPERSPSHVPPCLSSSRGKRLWSHSAAITSDLMAKRVLRVSLLQPDIKPECLIAAFAGRKLSCRIFWLVFIYLRQLNGFPLTTHTRTYGRKSTYMTPLTSLCRHVRSSFQPALPSRTFQRRFIRSFKCRGHQARVAANGGIIVKTQTGFSAKGMANIKGKYVPTRRARKDHTYSDRQHPKNLAYTVAQANLIA